MWYKHRALQSQRLTATLLISCSTVCRMTATQPISAGFPWAVPGWAGMQASGFGIPANRAIANSTPRRVGIPRGLVDACHASDHFSSPLALFVPKSQGQAQNLYNRDIYCTHPQRSYDKDEEGRKSCGKITPPALIKIS